MKTLTNLLSYPGIANVMASLKIPNMNNDTLQVICATSRHIWAMFRFSPGSCGVWKHIKLERKSNLRLNLGRRTYVLFKSLNWY
jgi:hypothetical protein